MKPVISFRTNRTIVLVASAVLLFSAGPIAAQVTAPGNGKALPDSAQNAPPFQQSGGGGGGGGGTPPGGDFNALLNGVYIYSGPASCVFSSVGFNQNFQPIGGGFFNSYMVNGTRTFNGNGTGTMNANSLAVSGSGASSNTFSGDFTYQLNSDLTITIWGGTSTSTNTQTQQVGLLANVPELRGRVSEDLSTIAVMHYEPRVEEIQTASGVTTGYRICTRGRTLTRLQRAQ